jgi:diguanylate cyclase (GGDEF)-like protein
MFRTLLGSRCMALILGLVVVCSGAVSASAANAPVKTIRVGITAFRDKAQTVREWQPTMDYLAERIPGTRFIAIPMALPDFEVALPKGEIDYVITNPQEYILLESLFGVSRVATLVKRENDKIVGDFGGVIFTRHDRQDINNLADVRNRRIAAIDRLSFAGFLAQYDVLRKSGIDIDAEATLSYLGFPQDLCVQAVLRGDTDIGFVRTGLLEAMAKEGKLDLRQIKVINPVSAGDFPFLASTPLYPEWPIAVTRGAPLALTNDIVAALLLMPPDAPPAKSARYYRWSSPHDYNSVAELMHRYRIRPFDHPAQVTLTELFQRYGAHISAGAALFSAILIFLYLRSQRLNVALNAAQRRLSEMAYYDPLTRLPNRMLLDDRLNQGIAQAKRAGTILAVGLIDLDGFKPINDTFGHKVGDAVLQEVAHRLSSILREGDTVARLGGDEFVVLLGNLQSVDESSDVASRLLSILATKSKCCPSAATSASIGFSFFPADALEPDDLLRKADQAMYQAKRAGGNQVMCAVEKHLATVAVS